MAKNIGLIKISGKVGDLQFFNKNGNSFVGLSSNVGKERILKDPAFKRTRENMAEFGGAAGVSKQIREHLIPLRNLTEKNLHTRFARSLRLLMNVGTGVKGKRKVEFSLNQAAFNGFELNNRSKVGEVLFVPVNIASNTERNQAVLTLPEFLPANYLLIPDGASHYKIHLAALSTSDFEPQGVSSLYGPTNVSQHGLFAINSTNELSIDNTVTGGISLTVDLPGTPTLDPDVSLFTFFGIEFFQEVNGAFYQLASNNAVRIEKVF